MKIPFLTVAALALAALAHAQTSVASGVWTDPAIWDTGTVPTTTATVTIAAGHTVGLVPAGVRSTPVTVASLTVDGTLTATFPEGAGGEDVTVYATALVNNGTIRAETDPAGSGGSVLLSTTYGPVGFPPIFGPVPGTFLNTGSVLGGDGSSTRSGGSVTVFYVNGGATNSGLLLGGDGNAGGLAWMVAATSVNDGGLVRGGDGDASRGGDGRVTAMTFPPGGTCSASNLENSVVRGGDADEGRGGNGEVSAFAIPFSTSTALNEGRIAPTDTPALIRGGDGCQAGDAILVAMFVTNRGALEAGTEIPSNCPPPPPRRAFCEPPDGVIEGDATIEADLIELVAGGNLTIGGLAPGAITAQEDLVITMAPGGVLDLTGLAPGSVSAMSSTLVQADTILLPPGLGLTDLIAGGPVTVSAGGRHAEPHVVNGLHSNVAPGEEVSFPVVVENRGNLTEDFELQVDGPPGWPDFAAPIVHNFTLTPGGSWSTTIETTVPLSFPYDAYDHLLYSVRTTTAGEPEVVASGEHTFEIDTIKPAAESYGQNQPLSMHVEPGAAVTAPFLAIEGGSPFGLASVAIASARSNGVPAIPGLPQIYVDPTQISSWATVPLFAGQFQVPINLQNPGFAGITFYFQAIELTAPGFPASNGLALTFAP